MSYSLERSKAIELKLPSSKTNSKLTFDLLAIFKTFEVPAELLEKIFSPESLNLEDYPTTEPLKLPNSLPQFLFTNRSSYFDVGKLGRQRLNQRLNLFSQLSEHLSKGALYDHEGKLVFEKNLLNLKKSPGLTIPHSTNELHCLKIKSPRHPEKTAFLVGYNQEISEEKTYFDLADLIGI